MRKETLINGSNVLARVLIASVFVKAAMGNKIPEFEKTVQYMISEGVPFPHIMLAGAIAFLLLGSCSLIMGCKTRVGVSLLVIFLILATYYFHDFWTFEDPGQQQTQLNHFMKNLALIGVLIFVGINGPGKWSLDESKFH